MDYSRLSRETLIHEINQLNNQIERLKIKNVGTEIDIDGKLDAIPFPVYLIQMDYSVLWANSYCVQNYKDILGRKCYQVFYEFNDICPGCPMQLVIEHKSVFETIVTPKLQNKDDESRVYRNQLIPLVSQGKINAILEIQENIVKREHYEENLKEIVQNLKNENNELKKKLLKTHEFIEYFASEMRTPIRSLRGFFELFDTNYLSGLQVEYLKVIKYNKTEFNFRNAIDEVVKTYRHLYSNEKNNNIRLEYSDSIPEILIGDVVKLKLVISYLLETSNHLCQNDNIIIKVSEVTENKDKIHLKISISDSSENVAGRMIDLSDYDIKTRSNFKSIEEYAIAMGLHLSRELTQASGGMIEISNIKDKGINSKLFLTFEKVTIKSKIKETQEIFEKKRILIADGDRPQIPMEYLEKYDIYFARTGKQAIDMFFDYNPQLVIMNVMIEDCDGFSAYDEIERRKRSSTPIIAISNKLIDNESEFMKDYGFDDYYPKPITELMLKNILDIYL